MTVAHYAHALGSRTLVISDIHGNFAALEAVLAAEPHDVVICLGDLVGYGPEPAACVRRIRSSADLVVQGNHDRAFGEGVPPGCSERFRWLAEATTPIARRHLTTADTTYLSKLPHWAYLERNGVRYMFVHATPGDPLYQYLGPDAYAWAGLLAGIDADVVVVGHTHVQFDLCAGGRRVVNPGSVGQPKDGDPQAAYAILDENGITLRRVKYDVARTIDALERAGVSPYAVDYLAQLLHTGTVPARRAPTRTPTRTQGDDDGRVVGTAGANGEGANP